MNLDKMKNCIKRKYYVILMKSSMKLLVVIDVETNR